MFSYLWLLCKRAAVLTPGVIVAVISARTVLPYFHRWLPFALAAIATYIIVAYVFIPGIMHFWRFIVPGKQLPLYCTTPDGFASDPINIGLVGSRQQLITAMQAAGWEIAKPITLRTVTAMLWAILLKRSYHGMPLSSLYLFGRRQDIGFEIQLMREGRGRRHHVRFWATTISDIENGSLASAKLAHTTEEQIADKIVWAGAASLDVGITFAAGSLQFTHAVSPNTNRERALLVRQLESRGLAEAVTELNLHTPYDLPNFAWSRTLQTDGKMTILRLKSSAAITSD